MVNIAGDIAGDIAGMVADVAAEVAGVTSNSRFGIGVVWQASGIAVFAGVSNLLW